MNDLTARLESLLSRYASALDAPGQDDAKSWEQFCKELRWLIAEYGAQAVDDALNELPDGAGAATALH
jgi:hypothetical protein